jgi:DNA-binding NarL/FixJ family response regulator
MKTTVRTVLIVSRSLGLCRFGKWLLRRMRVRRVKTTHAEGQELLKIIKNFRPEIVLFDAWYYHEATARKIGLLLNDLPDLDIAVFSMLNMPSQKSAYFLLYGAQSYIDLEGSGAVWKGLKTIMNGKKYITPRVKKEYEDMPDIMPEVRYTNTDRQEQIKYLIFRGLRNNEIAEILRLSVKTVELHKHYLFQNYGVKSSLELFRQCYLLGELDDKKLINKEQLPMSN